MASLERDEGSGRDERVEEELKQRLAHRVTANRRRIDRLRMEPPGTPALVDGDLRRTLEALGYVADSPP